jgi:hypothetical protein
VGRRARSFAPVLASRSARVGVALLRLLAVTAVAGPFVAPGDGDVVSMLATRDTGPSWTHLFGTTIQGQDVLSQVLDAAPLTLALVAGSSALALALATLCGIAAGAFGGAVDRLVGLRIRRRGDRRRRAAAARRLRRAAAEHGRTRRRGRVLRRDPVHRRADDARLPRVGVARPLRTR